MKIDPQLLEFAKSMRHAATDAENLLWQLLRAKRFMNLKFRRQQVIEPYIVIFTVMKLVLMNIKLRTQFSKFFSALIAASANLVLKSFE